MLEQIVKLAKEAASVLVMMLHDSHGARARDDDDLEVVQVIVDANTRTRFQCSRRSSRRAPTARS